MAKTEWSEADAIRERMENMAFPVMTDRNRASGKMALQGSFLYSLQSFGEARFEANRDSVRIGGLKVRGSVRAPTGLSPPPPTVQGRRSFRPE
jgi:hypothetical protein